MKVIQINCVYQYGSTGKIVDDIHNFLKCHNVESHVFYGRGVKVSEENVTKVSSEFEAKVHSLLSRLFGVQFAFSHISTQRTIRLIERISPDVVHLHCLNGNFINVYKLLNYLKKNNIKTVLTLHAEIMHTAGCAHAMECEKWKKECNNCTKIRGIISKYFRDDAKYCFEKMQNAFAGFENLTVVGVSDWLTERAKQSAIFDDGVKFVTVNNGLDEKIFNFKNPENLKNRLKISKDKKVLLHVTPNFKDTLKGGNYILELAKMLPEMQFIIVGFNGDEKQLPQNVLPIKHTNNQEELAEYYSLADVTLLTSKRETFSMIVAESLCCATPVVGFKAGGPETIAIPEYSDFVEYGDTAKLKESIEKILSREYIKDDITTKALQKYMAVNMSNEYYEIYI